MVRCTVEAQFYEITGTVGHESKVRCRGQRDKKIRRANFAQLLPRAMIKSFLFMHFAPCSVYLKKIVS